VRAVPDLDLARIRQFCDTRVPKDLRDEARVEADVRGKSFTIFDCRPPWHLNLTDWSRVPIAQLRYDPADHAWTLYWADRNSRWHRYDLVDPSTADEHPFGPPRGRAGSGPRPPGPPGSLRSGSTICGTRRTALWRRVPACGS
jgi:hypothetical protein